MKVIEDILGKGSPTELINDESVCRTAPATQGLSKKTVEVATKQAEENS